MALNSACVTRFAGGVVVCSACLFTRHAALIFIPALGLLQELRQGKADLPTVIEGFFLGVFEAKGLDRSGFVVRCFFTCSPPC